MVKVGNRDVDVDGFSLGSWNLVVVPLNLSRSDDGGWSSGRGGVCRFSCLGWLTGGLWLGRGLACCSKRG